jgi:hypothetical protein
VSVIIADDPTEENLALRLWREGKLPCVNCGRVMRCPKRGLCVTCYKRSEIRARFPSRSKFHNHFRERRQHPLPRCSTQALPGSREKIEVLMERAARQEQLFHPGDTRDLLRIALRPHKKGTKRHFGCETIQL